MGFYDFRCMLTGVSLLGVDAVAVALEPFEGGYRPITLGVAGSYDRLGSIDDIAEDLNASLIHAWFVRQDLRLDPGYRREFGDPPRDIEHLFRYFERNVSDSTDEHPALALNGKRIFSALVEKNIWDALAAATDADFKALFGDSPIPNAIYADRIAELSVAGTYAVNRLAPAWAPMDPDEIGAQHDEEEILEWIASARARFRDEPVVLRGLDAYAEDMREILDED